MMRRYPEVSSNALEKALTRRGFTVARSSGKHVVWSDGQRRVAVPHQRHGINPRTLKDILANAGMTPDEFRQLIRG